MMAGEVHQFRCPCCGSSLDVRPAGQTAAARPQKPMTENQRGLIEDYCAENREPFPAGLNGFSSDQASEWIDQHVPPEYIAWRKRRLYGCAGNGQFQGARA